MIGRNPPATAVSITDVVGKQNSVVTPSRFRISTTAWSARICPLPCGVCRSLGAGRRARLQSAHHLPHNKGRTSCRPRSVAAQCLGAGAAAAALPRRARAADKPIRIGVLTDMGGPYAANTGLGSVLGAQMAVEDFMRNNPSIKAEVVQADLQLKPDVAVAIAARLVRQPGRRCRHRRAAVVGGIRDRRHGEAEGQGGDLHRRRIGRRDRRRSAAPTISTSSTTPGRCRTPWSMRR